MQTEFIKSDQSHTLNSLTGGNLHAQGYMEVNN
jgi:hypothetical protein